MSLDIQVIIMNDVDLDNPTKYFLKLNNDDKMSKLKELMISTEKLNLKKYDIPKDRERNDNEHGSVNFGNHKNSNYSHSYADRMRHKYGKNDEAKTIEENMTSSKKTITKKIKKLNTIVLRDKSQGQGIIINNLGIGDILSSLDTVNYEDNNGNTCNKVDCPEGVYYVIYAYYDDMNIFKDIKDEDNNTLINIVIIFSIVLSLIIISLFSWIIYKKRSLKNNLK
jgi:hypothetical protein